MYPARDCLRKDVAAKRHQEMTPYELWESRPTVYKDFDQTYFRNRIYQTVRREKYVNYLQQQREEKNKVLRCKPPLEKIEALDIRTKRQNNGNKKQKL